MEISEEDRRKYERHHNDRELVGSCKALFNITNDKSFLQYRAAFRIHGMNMPLKRYQLFGVYARLFNRP